MTTKQIAAMIASVGVPYVYYQFPDGTGQEPPFICFYYPESADFYADNTAYMPAAKLIVELYADKKDFTLEAALERVLTENGLAWKREEAYLDSERMFLQAYRMIVPLTKEE